MSAHPSSSCWWTVLLLFLRLRTTTVHAESLLLAELVGGNHSESIRLPGATVISLPPPVAPVAAAAPLVNRRLWPDYNRSNAPQHVVQYGIPRTASTYQWETLCVMMLLAWEGDDPICYFEPRFYGVFDKKRLGGKHHVVKTHSLGDKAQLDKTASVIRQHSTEAPVWVFVTSDGRNHEALQAADSLSRSVNTVRVPLEMDVHVAQRRGIGAIYEYQDFFNASEREMELVYDFIHYWDILRLCCGPQMAEDWRHELIQQGIAAKAEASNTSVPRDHYKPHHGRHTPGFSACEAYDIDKVEALVMDTAVWKRFHKVRVHNQLALGVSTSTRHPTAMLDGTYCSRCNAAIRKHGLQFNQGCVK